MLKFGVAIVRLVERTDLRLLFEYLAERLHEPDWAVGIKTFHLLHTLMLDSNRPVEYLQSDTRWFTYAMERPLYQGDELQLRRLNHPKHAYVQMYAEYIGVVVDLGGFFALEWLDLDLPRHLRQEQLQRLFRVSTVLLEKRIFLDDLGDEIIQQLYYMLTSDLVVTYPIITKLMISLLQDYESLTTKEALTVQSLYKQFVSWHGQIVDRFEQARRLNLGLSIPTVVPMGSLVELPLPNQREEAEIARRQAILSQDPYADVEQ